MCDARRLDVRRTVKRIVSIILIVTAAVALGTSVGLVAPPRAGASVSLTRIERQVLACVNQKRAAHGLVRVRAQAALMSAARAHSRDMARHSYFSHTSVAGRTYVQRVIAYGYGTSGWSRWTVGENIYSARTGTLLATAQVAVMRWMSNTVHRRVLLGRCYRDVGIGVHGTGTTRYFTLDLGRRDP
jgi:uncharacterized protein YkwD